jgi:hypothetical protein
MGGFFGLNVANAGQRVVGNVAAGGGFFGEVAAPVSGAPVTTTFQITSGDNANGPLSTSVGAGEGFYDGSTSTGAAHTGTIIPAPSFVFGQQVSCWAFQGGPTPKMVFVLFGTLAATFFTKLNYTDKNGLQTLLRTAALFDSVTFPGFSVWTWPPPSGNFPFTNAVTYPITVTQ